jgi:nitrogen-specific signal transduction histidine kinase
MPDKTSGKPRKMAAKAARSSAAAVRGAAEKADQYIADQLKLMYDAVVVEPVPDRLLQLLDRLDNEEEESNRAP